MTAAEPVSTRKYARQLWSIVEVLGVFVVGHFLSFVVLPWLKVPSLGAALQTHLSKPDPDYIHLAWIMTRVLIVQYLCLLAIVVAIHWKQRILALKDFGFTFANETTRHHLSLAMAGFAIGSLPMQLLFLVNQYVNLGDGPALWVVFSKPWPLSFWVFAAAGSFILIPIFEEWFYRGYCQARLQVALPAGVSIVIVSILFTLTHSQYHRISVLSVGTIIGIFVLSVVTGYSFWRTKSLIAPILIHALVDIPIKPHLLIYRLAVTMLLLLLFRNTITSMMVSLRRNYFFSTMSYPVFLWGALGAAVAAISFSIFPTATAVVGFLALIAVVVSLRKESHVPARNESSL